MVCNFCGLKSKCSAFEKEYYEYLNIFRSDLVKLTLDALERENNHIKKTRICNNCLQNLKVCFSFAQQVQKVQQQLILKEQQASVKTICKILPKPRSNDEKLLLAVKNVKPARSYKCSECASKFIAFRQLQAHIKEHRPTQDEIISICCYCCSLYANDEALQRHQKESHIDEKYFCPPCKKHYKTNGHLLRHVNKTHSSNTMLYYCTLCPAAVATEYTSRNVLTRHFQEVHLQMPAYSEEDDAEIEMKEEFLDDFLLNDTNDNSFQFSECWEALDLHLPDVLRMHNGADNPETACPNATTAAFKCPKCCEDCLNQRALLFHLGSKHAMKVLACNKCESSFENMELLKLHKANCIQTNIAKGTTCSICEKNFKTNVALNSHLKTHNNIPSLCPYCGKSFRANVNLKQHLRIVHSLLKPHVCQLCDKTFATVDHLKKHVLSQHQNERKHICNVCEKKFTQLCHLKQHLIIHTSEKPQHCNICAARFWKKIDLERHTLQQHA